MSRSLPILSRRVRDNPVSATGTGELIIDGDHLRRVVIDGMMKAKISLDIATADFKAMLVPAVKERRAPSIIEHFRRLAEAGVEIRLMHAGTPSSAALQELKRALPDNLTIRRCPRLHAKIVNVDSRKMYIGSANLTGAGLGAKGAAKRNFEVGLWTSSASLIESVSEYFNALWEGAHCAGCQRRNVCPVPLEEPRL